MAVFDSELPTQQISKESRDQFYSQSDPSTCSATKHEHHEPNVRAMQPGLKFQDNRSLLQGEDVEVFFKNLEAPEVSEQSEVETKPEIDQSSSSEDLETGSVSAGSVENEEAMFQNSMHAVQQMPGSTPTYDTTGAAGTGAMTSGVNPVYVPTTRPVLPPMHYIASGAAGQGVSSPNSPAMWPMNSADPSYSVSNPHSSVSPRFAFAPSPGSPISTPAARAADTSFTSPLARPSGINPYHTYMGTPEISSAWNFQMAIQQGFRQTGPGKSKSHINTV